MPQKVMGLESLVYIIDLHMGVSRANSDKSRAWVKADLKAHLIESFEASHTFFYWLET